MKKTYNARTEHYLVPAVLFLLNICLVHVIYAFTPHSSYTATGKMALTLAFLLFALSLFLKKPIWLRGAIVYYVLIAFCL